MSATPRFMNPADDMNGWPHGAGFRNGRNWTFGRKPQPGDRPCLYVLPSAATAGPLSGAFKVGVTIALPQRYFSLTRAFGSFNLARAYAVWGRSRADIGLLEDLVNTRFGMARQWKPTIYSCAAGNLHHGLEPGPGLRMHLDQQGDGSREWLDGHCWETVRTFIGMMVQLMGLDPTEPRRRLWLREDLRFAIHGQESDSADSPDGFAVSPWPTPSHGHPLSGETMMENLERVGSSDAEETTSSPPDRKGPTPGIVEIQEKINALHWRCMEADTQDLLLRLQCLQPFINAIVWSLADESEELEPRILPPDEAAVYVAVMVQAGPWRGPNEDRAHLSGLLGNRVAPVPSSPGYPILSGVSWTPQRVVDTSGQLVGWVDQAFMEITLSPIGECSPATAQLRRGLDEMTRRQWARQSDGNR